MWRTPRITSVAQASFVNTCLPKVGAPVLYYSGPNDIKSRAEYIDSSSGKYRSNACSHYIYGCIIGPGPITYYNTSWQPHSTWNTDKDWNLWQNQNVQAAYAAVNGANPHFGSAWYPFTGLPLLYADDLPQGRRIPLPADWSDLKTQSISAMLPGIQARMSLINSLIELKDFARLGLQLRRACSQIERISAFARVPLSQDWLIHRAQGEYGVRSCIRDILKLGADSWLQSQFNFQPLVSDIIAINRAMVGYEQEVRNLLDREGLPQKHHFRRVLSSTYPDSVESDTTTSPQDPNWASVFGGFTTTRIVRYDARLFTGTCRYSYELPDWQRENALVYGFLDRVGVNLNPAIIWNAIPWSFVIDWATGVSRWLGQFRTPNLEPRVRITSVSHSLRVDRWISLNMKMSTGPYGPSVGNDTRVSDVHEIAYLRDPTLPELTRSIEMSGLSLKEISLAGALGICRTSR